MTTAQGSQPEERSRPLHGRVSGSDPCELPPPHGLEAYTFELEGEEYAVFAFELPRIEPPAGLSPKERQVVELLMEGLSNAEIARRRGVSVNTVANQLRSIYGKLGLAGRVELIRHCALACGKSVPTSR